MVELLGLETKLCVVNAGRCPAMTLYLYGDSTYSIVYGIMESYKNHFNHPKTTIHDQFNKTISRLRIKVEHSFAIY